MINQVWNVVYTKLYLLLEHKRYIVVRYIDRHIREPIAQHVLSYTFWDKTPLANRINHLRDRYLIVTNSRGLYPRIAFTLITKQLNSWKSSNILSKHQTIGIAASIIKQSKDLFSVVGIQPLTNDKQITYWLRYSGSTDNVMTLSVIKQPVHQLDELPIINGINNIPDNILFNTIANQYVSVMQQTILSKLVELALQHTAEYVDTTYSIDSISSLLQHIHKQSIKIATTTRRSAGNFIITSAHGASVLGMSAAFKSKSDVDYSAPFKQIGTLYRYNVYTTNSPIFDGTPIPYLIGYCSDRTEVDTGCVLAMEQLFEENDTTLVSKCDLSMFEANDLYSVKSDAYYRMVYFKLHD